MAQVIKTENIILRHITEVEPSLKGLTSDLLAFRRNILNCLKG